MVLGGCPKEYPVVGGHRGPSMLGLVCSKFEVNKIFSDKQKVKRSGVMFIDEVLRQVENEKEGT
jgi:hypothetical protein